MSRRLFLFALLLILLALAATPGRALQGALTPTPAASQSETPPTATATPLPTDTAPPETLPTQTPLPVVIPLTLHEPTPVGYGPQEYPLGVNPLTGLPVEDAALLERRPLVIKVTNYPRTVRPQAGLSLADIVFEYYIERGVTRFISVFYGQDAAKVGPVRSGRFFDEHIFRMFDGIFVFGYADKRVMDYFLSLEPRVANSFVLESDNDRQRTCSDILEVPLCRDREIISYNNLFANTEALSALIERRARVDNDRPDLSGLRFEFRIPPGGQPALNLYVRFSNFIYTRWAYSLSTGRYLRFEETVGYADPDPALESYAPHTDALTGEQIAADNLVLLVVPHEYYVKTNTTEILKINLLGWGRAYIFRDGYAYPAVWQRPADGGVLQLFTPEGAPFPLKPGNTWFEVLSEETVLLNGVVDWRFRFHPPTVPDEPIRVEEATPQE